MSVLRITENGDIRAVMRDLLKRLLDQRIVEAVYVPLRTAASDGIVPSLVSSADVLDAANPLAPVMPISGARAVASLTTGGAPGPLAVVLRPCEIRALIELTKLKQASLEHLTIIGVDCPGTYEVMDFACLCSQGIDVTGELLSAAREGRIQPHEGYAFRPACQMCEHPTPSNAHISIGYIGVEGVLVETADEREAAPSLLQGEGWGEGGREVLARRHEALQRLLAERTVRREAALSALSARLNGPVGLADYFALCQRCHNCVVACPICYCKECLFRTAALEHEPGRYLRWAQRKGATRVPADTVLFHLTRLNHMATSCVGCGLCESACPNDIPLTVLFRTVAARTQALFNYVPGRRLDEEIPLMTFREAELQELR